MSTVKYLRGSFIVIRACIRYLRYVTTDEQFVAEANRGFVISGRPPITDCPEHGIQQVHTVPGVANEPTCIKCI